MDNVGKDLEYSGRKANVELGNFRLYGKSKHQQYFTSMELSRLICDVLRPAYMDEKTINVLDPTCGSGRLLIPWKRLGANVLGIELDKEPAKVAKRLLGEKNVRVGDILSYVSLLRSQFDLVVTNPPYGIMWQAPEEHAFESVSYGGNIESQAATIEICTRTLRSNGLLAAIIPTTTFTNQKDAKLREHLFKNYRIWLRVNLGADFKKEYGIEAEVDLVIGQREYYACEGQKYETVDAVGLSSDERFLLLTEKVYKILDNRDRKIYCWGGGIDVPDLSKVKTIDISGAMVHIKPSGFETKCHNKALIDFYDRFLTDYNPVYGTQSGIADAYLSGPALIWRGADPAVEMLKNLGFDAVCDDDSRQKLARLRKKYTNLSTPIYRPKPHQLLAYFYDKEYVAKADVHGPGGELLFKEGEFYRLHPAWERNRETVDVAEAYSERKKQYYTIRTDIDRGFLAIRVQTEAGERIFKETEAKEVELFMKAFDVPDVGDVQLLYPDKLSRVRERVEKEMPFLFDYQKEDVARLALKPFGYLGYDMGGGKTVSSAAWATLRNYRLVLIVCHSGLVKNCLNELDKFGFKGKKLTTHQSVEKLLKNLGRIKEEGTTFYVTSYEFLSLDTGRKFDPWDCIEYDRDGNIRRKTVGNTYRKCKDCGRDYSKVHKSCPKCEEVKKWTGIYCNKCGYSAYTYSSEKKMYPAYKRMSKLFDAVIVDEAQVAKSKNTMRGRAVRAMKSKGKLILTGTLMKGYVTDVFWNIGWLLGHGKPLFPYDYRGGSKRFLEEFGTFKYVTKEFEDTLHEGRAQLIPEVSNLNRFWRIIASFTIRRMKDEMVELPKKHKHIITMAMDPLHADVYESFRGWAQNLISREFQNATRNGRDVNMGVISKALWKLRFAATVPNAKAYLGDESGPGVYLDNGHRWNKLRKIIDITQEVKERGQKIIIFSALRPMVSAICKAFDEERIRYIKITASNKTSSRFDMIQDFSEEDGVTAIVAGLNVLNRGFTITAASNVIISDMEYTPESTLQAEDRAHRTGQERDVNVYYLMSEETIDEQMFSLVSQKQAAISNAIDGKARHLDVADLLNRLDANNIQLEMAKKVLVSTSVKAVNYEEEDRGSVETVTMDSKKPENNLNEELYEKLCKEREKKLKNRKPRSVDERQITLF